MNKNAFSRVTADKKVCALTKRLLARTLKLDGTQNYFSKTG